METRNSIHTSDFILFRGLQEKQQLCKLKDFINFIKFSGDKLPYRFSFVESEGQLLNTLTLRQNIILESIPTTLSSKNNEIQLASHIKKTGNLHLMRLFNKLSLLDVYPNKIDAQSRKIAALVQGLLKDSKYLFFQAPEKHLKDEILDLFIKALLFQQESKKQSIILHSPKEEIWLPYSNKIAQKELYFFTVTPKVKEERALPPELEATANAFELEKSKEAA